MSLYQVLLFSDVSRNSCHAEPLTDEILENIQCGSAYAGDKPLDNEDPKASKACSDRFYDY